MGYGTALAGGMGCAAVPITTGYVNIAWGGFIVRPEVDDSLPFYFTGSNKTQLKIKGECAGNSAGKGKPQTAGVGDTRQQKGFWG